MTHSIHTEQETKKKKNKIIPVSVPFVNYNLQYVVITLYFFLFFYFKYFYFFSLFKKNLDSCMWTKYRKFFSINILKHFSHVFWGLFIIYSHLFLLFLLLFCWWHSIPFIFFISFFFCIYEQFKSGFSDFFVVKKFFFKYF